MAPGAFLLIRWGLASMYLHRTCLSHRILIPKNIWPVRLVVACCIDKGEKLSTGLVCHAGPLKVQDSVFPWFLTLHFWPAPRHFCVAWHLHMEDFVGILRQQGKDRNWCLVRGLKWYLHQIKNVHSFNRLFFFQDGLSLPPLGIPFYVGWLRSLHHMPRDKSGLTRSGGKQLRRHCFPGCLLKTSSRWLGGKHISCSLLDTSWILLNTEPDLAVPSLIPPFSTLYSVTLMHE